MKNVKGDFRMKEVSKFEWMTVRVIRNTELRNEVSN